MCDPEIQNINREIIVPTKNNETAQDDLYFCIQEYIDSLAQNNPEKIREEFISGKLFTHKVNKGEQIPTHLQSLTPVHIGVGNYEQGEPY